MTSSIHSNCTCKPPTCNLPTPLYSVLIAFGRRPAAILRFNTLHRQSTSGDRPTKNGKLHQQHNTAAQQFTVQRHTAHSNPRPSGPAQSNGGARNVQRPAASWRGTKSSQQNRRASNPSVTKDASARPGTSNIVTRNQPDTTARDSDNARAGKRRRRPIPRPFETRREEGIE